MAGSLLFDDQMLDDQRPQQILPAAWKGGRIQRWLAALGPALIDLCQRLLVRTQMRQVDRLAGRSRDLGQVHHGRTASCPAAPVVG